MNESLMQVRIIAPKTEDGVMLAAAITKLLSTNGYDSGIAARITAPIGLPLGRLDLGAIKRIEIEVL